MSKRPTFEAVFNARLTRRTVLAGAAASVGLAACARPLARSPAAQAPSAFVSVPQRRHDTFLLAEGYRHNLVARWGDSLVTGTADLDSSRLPADNWLNESTAAAQERQFGANCDGVGYFAQEQGRAARGLVCVNHEYVNAELIWPGHRGPGMPVDERRAWMSKHPQAVQFMQAAHGVSVTQIYRDAHGWQRDNGSRFNRRITARTPMDIAGPARGHALMRTRADPSGTRVLGTLANCASGKTPWGTYLTAEENFDDYFAFGRTVRETTNDAVWLAAAQRLALRENGFYGWDMQDPRFDARQEPNEFFRFGWMVEIDPHDPHSMPRKRTTLGRFKHEGANTIVGRTGHVAAYMGDDEEFEYIYKFVTRDRFDPKNPAANRDLLDHGTLYCARFDADGSGAWLPLVHDEKGPLNSGAGFASQGDVLIKVRAAADLLGATPMDRPEDVEPSPLTGRIYFPCTKGDGRTEKENLRESSGRRVDTGADAANPRPANRSGHIIEMTEAGDDATATRFEWNVFLLAGDPAAGRYIVDARELVPGSLASADTYFAGYPHRVEQPQVHCPDNLGFDLQGNLWIVTDADDRTFPNNGCFMVPTSGPQRGLLRQLASGPTGSEICGCEFTPDGRTLFLAIQHPGEGGTIDKPRSHWPDGDGLPARAALLAIEREDGQPV